MIEIVFPLHRSDQGKAGAILYEAFRRKLQPPIGEPDKTTVLFTAALNLNMLMGARIDGRLVGVAGLHNHGGNYAHTPLQDSIARLGAARGFSAWVTLNLFAAGPGCREGDLRIAALAVAAASRGQGVGSCLLESIFDKARREAYRAVRLEVVDTNTRARQLYERLGFTVERRQRFPLLRGWLGFSGDFLMVKRIAQPGQDIMEGRAV